MSKRNLERPINFRPTQGELDFIDSMVKDGQTRSSVLRDIVQRAMENERIPVDLLDLERGIIDLLKRFSDAVKEYVKTKDEDDRFYALQMYEKIVKYLPGDSPQIRSLDSLRSLLKDKE